MSWDELFFKRLAYYCCICSQMIALRIYPLQQYIVVEDSWMRWNITCHMVSTSMLSMASNRLLVVCSGISDQEVLKW